MTDANSLLKEQGLPIKWDLEGKIALIYELLDQSFTKVSRSAKIWDTYSRKNLNYQDRIVQRTISHTTIQREIVKFARGRPSYLPHAGSEPWARVPQMNNEDSTNNYIFPSFLIFDGKNDFAVINPADIEVTVRIFSFVETEGVPYGTEITGNTWRYANKDGSPERRYAVNPSIPIVQYAAIGLQSGNLIKEEFMFSSCDAALEFGIALQTYCEWFKTNSSDYVPYQSTQDKGVSAEDTVDRNAEIKKRGWNIKGTE